LRKKPAPTAIFCFNDEMAMAELDAPARGTRSRRTCPSWVSTTSVGRYLDPPLTTVTQPMREIGEGCVRLLLGI